MYTKHSLLIIFLTDQHIRLYDTTLGQFKEFRNIVARDVGWSVIDTDYRYISLSVTGIDFNNRVISTGSERQCIIREISTQIRDYI